MITLPSAITPNEFVDKEAKNWHQYFTGAGQDDNSPQWIKLASWTHANKYNTFGAQFNIVNRNANLALKVHVNWSNSVFLQQSTAMSFEGAASQEFKARLVKTLEHNVNGLLAVDMELWVRHGAYSQKGYVSVERIGGHRFELVPSIKLDYDDVRTPSTLGNEIEPAGEVIRAVDYKSGINAMLFAPTTPLVMQNGFASHASPLSYRVSVAGLVEVSGVIDPVNEDGTPATITAYTIFSRIPSQYAPPRYLRVLAAAGSSGMVPIHIDTGGAVQFTADTTSRVYVHFQYQL